MECDGRHRISRVGVDRGERGGRNGRFGGGLVKSAFVRDDESRIVSLRPILRPRTGEGSGHDAS